MATPTATLPSVYGSVVTVVPPAGQNPPPSFIELASGKMLFFYSTGTSHLSTDGSLRMVTATSEAAALAGTFSSPVILRAPVAATGSVDPPPGDTTGCGIYFGGGYAAQQKEGTHRGRIWLISGSGVDLPTHSRAWNEWRAWLNYSDDDGVTWSPFVEIPNLFDGGFGVDAHIKGMGINHPLIEIPGTDGLEWVVAVLGFDSDQFYEYSKLLATTDGPDGTWSVRSVIQDGEGPTIGSGHSPSEPTGALVYKPDGTEILMVGVDYWPSLCYSKRSLDRGVTYVEGAGTGVTIGSPDIAPPAMIQCPDMSEIAMTRKLTDNEHTWLNRSVNDGVSWGQHWLFDSGGRMRYGNFQVLQSLRVGMCYGVETVVTSSTEASIKYASLTIAPPTGGSAPAIPSSSIDPVSSGVAEFSAQLTAGGMLTWCRVEYGPTTAYGSVTPWVLKPPSAAFPHTITEELTYDGGAPLHARLVAKNLVGTATGADVEYVEPVAPLVLEPDAEWSQLGSALTVVAAIGVRTTVQATVTGGGGLVRFAGPDAARFEVSADGVTWAPTLAVSAGVTTVYLGVTPTGPGALVAEVGVPH